MEMYDYIELMDGFEGLMDGFLQLGMIYNMMLIIALIIPYIFTGYMIMCIGRKAGLNRGDDWMPFIPIARQIYQMRIADCPMWYVLLFQGCFINWAIMLILVVLFSVLFKSLILTTMVAMVYLLATLAFTFLYYRKYYPLFGFDPNTAWLEIIWSFGLIRVVLLVLIALYSKVTYRDAVVIMDDDGRTGDNKDGRRERQPNQGKAIITGIAGKYAGATFDISNGDAIVFGRSATGSNVVFDQFETDISRRHCAVKYSAQTDQFIVTDYSTNGTYFEDGSRLTANQSISVMRGTVIHLGKNKKNAFRLG